MNTSKPEPTPLERYSLGDVDAALELALPGESVQAHIARIRESMPMNADVPHELDLQEPA